MAKITKMKDLRRKRTIVSAMKRLFLLMIVGAVVFAVFYLTNSYGNYDIQSTFINYISELGAGPGYPVDLPTSIVEGLFPMKNDFVLLSDTNVYIYDQKGNQTLSKQHGFLRPTVETAKNRAIVYDRGAKAFQLLNKNKVLQTKNFDYPIYAADIGDNGNMVVATGSGQYIAEVIVYDANMEQIYKWYSAEKLVIDVSISDEKDEIAVACIEAENGKYKTTIYVFHFDMAKEFAKYEIQDAICYQINYNLGSTLHVVTDKALVLLSDELKLHGEFAFNGAKLSKFATESSDYAAVVLGLFHEERSQRICIVNNKGVVKADIKVLSKIDFIKFYDNMLYVLANDILTIYESNGEIKNTLKLDKARYFLPLGTAVTYTTDREICSVSIYRDKNKIEGEDELTPEEITIQEILNPTQTTELEMDTTRKSIL